MKNVARDGCSKSYDRKLQCVSLYIRFDKLKLKFVAQRSGRYSTIAHQHPFADQATVL